MLCYGVELGTPGIRCHLYGVELRVVLWGGVKGGVMGWSYGVELWGGVMGWSYEVELWGGVKGGVKGGVMGWS